MAKLHTLVDNFQDNSLDTGTWVTAGSVAETGGRAVITPTSSNSQLQAINAYDCVASHLIAHIPVVPPTGNTGTLLCGMVLADPNVDNQVGLFKEGNTLFCDKRVNGVDTNVASFTWNSAHTYWRFREAAGIFYWEVSPNGYSWSQLFSTTVSTNLFPLTNLVPYFQANFVGSEPSPGTFAIESINAIYLRNTSGQYALAYPSSSVTNNTTTSHPITGSGTTTTTGSGAVTILAAGTGNSLRDLAGNLAAGYTNQPVTNNTTTTSHPITASGTTTTTGSASLRRILAITGTGTTGRGVTYDGDIPYDSEVPYDPNFTGGSASLTIVGAGGTPFISGSGTTTTTGSASLQVVPPGGITASGTTFFTGSAVLEIPVISLTASGITTTGGTARLAILHRISGSGTTITSGSATLIQLTGFFTFEPPIVYDNPPTLPDPRPRYINSYARWKRGEPRGRTVLKSSGVYTVVDTPTVNEMTAADVVYQGGHVYTVDADEAFELIAAGFSVTGVQAPPVVDIAYPALDLYPATSLWPLGAPTILPSPTLLPSTGLLLP